MKTIEIRELNEGGGIKRIHLFVVEKIISLVFVSEIGRIDICFSSAESVFSFVCASNPEKTFKELSDLVSSMALQHRVVVRTKDCKYY